MSKYMINFLDINLVSLIAYLIELHLRETVKIPWQDKRLTLSVEMIRRSEVGGEEEGLFM